MVESRKLFVTGLTEQQWGDEMMSSEFSEELGLEILKNRPCYLCKRTDGEKSLCLVAGEEDKIEISNIELNHYKIESGNGIALSYLLCTECALLLNVMEKMEGA